MHYELDIVRDVKNLVTTGCDRAYIDLWSEKLGLTSLWREIA